MSSTNFTNSVTLTDADWFDDVDTKAYSYLTGVAGTNTITANGPVSLEAYAAGLVFEFIPANTNTAATTINITGASALGARNIFSNGAACVGGELRQNVPVQLIDDGTRFHILSNAVPVPFVDTYPVVVGSADSTKKVRFEVDGLTTATTRVVTVPDADTTIFGNPMTTIGDTVVATTAGAAARLPATASAAAHATTSDLFTARETLLTGAAVTFTDIADAPYVGATARVYMNAAHTFTDGAVFNVQGNANRTVNVGDWVRINAVTLSTFDVLFDKADGTAVVVAAPALPSYKIITFTRDISTVSGTQDITGVGFTPRFARFSMATTDNTSGRASWGEDDGTLRECVYGNAGGGGSFGRSSTYSIGAINGGAPVYEGYVSAWGADGCTITWTKTGSPTGTLSIIAYFYK